MLDLAAAFDASPNLYMVLDRELRYVAANRAYLATLGCGLQDLLGRPLVEVAPHDPDEPDNAQSRRLVESFRRVFDTGEADVLPLIHYRIQVDGPAGPQFEDRYWSATHTPLFDAEGRVEHVLQHTMDVTGLWRGQPTPPQVEASVMGRVEVVQQRNVALDEYLRRLLRLFEGAPVFMCFLRGPEHVFDLANAAYRRLVGDRELLGLSLREALPELDETYEQLLDQVVQTGQPFVGHRMRADLQRARGTPDEVYVDFVYQPILDESGRTLGVLVLGNDITEQVKAQAEVERLNSWLQSMFAQAPVAIAVLQGPEYTIRLSNARSFAFWGRPPEEVVGKRLFEAFPELDGQGIQELLDGVRATRRPHVGSERTVVIGQNGDGTLREVTFDFVYQPLFDEEGQVDSVVVVGSDVTEGVAARRRAESAHAELEALFECFPEALFVGDKTGIKRVNGPTREVLGYPHLEALQKSHLTLVTELAPRLPETDEPLAPHQTPFGRALRGLRTRMELIIRHRQTGQDRYVMCSGAPVTVGGQVTGAMVSMSDITERRQIERRALQLAKVLDETRDFVGISDLVGRPSFVNQAGRELIGLPDLGAACAVPVADYFVERQRAYVLDEVLPAALREGYWEGDLHFLHRVTGEEIPVRYTIFPLRDDSGLITALATITRDLRAQEAAEAERALLLRNERAARAQAEQANQLKDQFLATVSHELRTPLTSMLGWMQMLRSGMLPVEKHQRALETVERNARIQARLIDDLLDVGRIMSGKLALELELTDVSAVVSAAVEMVRPVAEDKRVGLAVNLEGSVLVMGDARRLQQVVWNLLTNAVKFTPPGGHVLLEVERLDREVELRVLDTGVGIGADFLPHVFERFRQAEVGPARKLGGLGLGLSIVRHVVEAHGGSVSAASDGEGRGARFGVRLPLASTGWRHVTAGPAPFSAPAALEGLHVLVVDDESDVREFVRSLLEECRARVSVACSAAEALQMVEAQQPDVLLSDLGMPDGDGFDLIAQVRALPESRGGRTPAVALTAYARPEDRARAMRAGFQNYVPKPVAPEELVAALAALAHSR
jgi:PAS domain S-box-containing protein